MRGSSLVMTAVVVVLVMMSEPTPCQAQWRELLPILTTGFTSLWQNNKMEFMGSTCFYTQKPQVKRWQLYYYGDFSCPTWTRIKGSAKTRSRSGVLLKTIEDFLNKAQDDGLVTQDEARIWLEGYQDEDF